MSFQQHTSAEMVDLLKKKPFQGQHPGKAIIIFLCSDANYSPEIFNHPFFDKIPEYQRVGLTFLEKFKCHHPFLLPDYPFNKTKAGVPFHRNFSKIGLNSEYASDVSFLELLDILTIGNKSQRPDLSYNLISEDHLRYIVQLILGGGSKLFFVSNGVLKNLMKLKKEYPVLKWLNITFPQTKQYSKTLDDNKVQKIFHFSSSQIHNQLVDIHHSISSWLNRNINTDNFQSTVS